MGCRRHIQEVVLALLGAIGAGCFGADPERAACVTESQPAYGRPADEVIELNVAVVEGPYGDPALNQDLWEPADEQVNLDRKRVLEDNGIRVCRITSQLPAGLTRLLKRSCPEPRQILTHAGNPTEVSLGPAWARMRFRYRPDGRPPAAVELAQAECLLEFVPAAAEEGRTILRFTPHVRHGTVHRYPQAEKTASGELRWKMEEQQSEEVYPDLQWELTVGAGEFVVVGTYLDAGRSETLGQRCFLPEPDGQRQQRVLVLRAARRTPEAPAAGAAKRPPPLALQASWAAARGTCR
jgi:hypothetical protein